MYVSDSLQAPLPPTFRSFPTFPSHRIDLPNPAPSRLLRSAFQLPTPTFSLSHPTPTPTAYRTRQASCISLAIASGTRGLVVGSVFGAAIGISTAVQSGYRGSTAVSYAGTNALRNAAAFGSWTSLYALSRCTLTRLRNRHDMFNAAAAGAFTGGVLTLISVRGHWRYAQSSIATNAAASAMVAVLFDALNQF